MSDARDRLPLTVRDLGRIGYAEALELQFDLVTRRQNEEITDTFLLVEHPPVLTMGRSAQPSDILLPPDELEARGVEIHRINRGGEVTYHGPGQIVGYLIINLYHHQRQLRKFIERLEEVFVRLLNSDYGIEARHDSENRGVWVGDEKITAIGIAIKQSVTMHGFAFNVNTDLSHFSWIVPCGIRDRGQTSLEKLTGAPVDFDAAKRQVVKHFCDVYGYEVVSEIRD